MKDTVIKVLLIAFIVIHVAIPIFTAATVGYAWSELGVDLYKNGVIIVLSAALLRLYNKKDRDE